MDGSTASLVIIPLVVMISLAVWLVAVYHADSHPRWQASQPVPGRDRSGRAMLAGSRLPSTQPRGDVTRINGAIRNLAGTAISQPTSWAGQAST
jgi:hypothetical protein